MQPFNFNLLLYVLLKFHFALLMLMGSMAEIFSFIIIKINLADQKCQNCKSETIFKK